VRVLILLLVLAGTARAEFLFRDQGPASIELTENGAPVFVYNHGRMLKDGVPADRARCCYLHPVYAPNGVVITDDFPSDHYHHRGVSWTWPVVTVDGKKYDLWTIRGILAKFERWVRKEAKKNKAVLAFENGWYVGDRRVVSEQVEIVVHPAGGGRRDLDFTVRLRAADADVAISGSPEGKGYGGFTIRFAPRTDTVIRTAGLEKAPDSDLRPEPWAQLTASFDGRQAGARITIDPSNRGYPNGWCLRNYGFLGVNFPGLQHHRLDPDAPLIMKFRMSLLSEREQGLNGPPR